MPYPSLTRPHRLRSSLRMIVSTVFVVASALALAPPASAAEYHLYSCHRPDGPLLNSDDWKPKRVGNVPLPSANCSRDAYAYWHLSESTMWSGEYAGVGLELPDGLKATYIDGDRWAMLLPGADDAKATITYDLISGENWETAASVLERCSLATGCSGWDTWDRPGTSQVRIGTVLDPPASFIGFRLGCTGASLAVCGGSSNQRGHVRINRLDVTIDDSSAPVGGAASGMLTQDGPRAANQSLSIAATDRGSGIYSASVLIDGNEVIESRPANAPACNDIGPNPGRWEFDRVQPCPLSAQLSFPVDTTKVTDGAHRLEVWVRDAAGNRTKTYEKTITIDNVPPPAVAIKPSITGGAPVGGLRPGDSIASQNGTWTGAGIAFTQRWQRSTVAGTWVDIPNATGGVYFVGKDDVGAALRVVVTARNAEGATEAVSEATGKVTDGKTVEVSGTKPVAVEQQPVANGGGGNPATGQLVVDREQRTVDVKHGAKVVITGRLVDADGNPIADATVDVYEQIAVIAAPWMKVDTVKTDSQGGYVYRPRTTSSRRLRFGFSQLRGDATYRATREVFVSVTAGMAIKARSKVVPRRGLIRIDGQVVVDRLPTGGALVEVQVLDAGMWRTVATRRANKVGKWSFKHRLRDASSTRFTFRSRLRTAGDLPSAEATSAPVKVRVR